MSTGAAIDGALSSAQNILNIGGSLLRNSTDAKIHAEVAQMQSEMLAMQQSLLETQQSIYAMRGELRRVMGELNRQADFDRYELVELMPGNRRYVYQLKDSERKPGEPMHRICPNCKDVFGVLSILQVMPQKGIHCPNPKCNWQG